MRKKELVILVAVIAALSAYLAFKEKGAVHYTLPEFAKVADSDVTRVVIQSALDAVTLKKTDKGWSVSPGNYPADGQVARDMLKQALGLELTALVSEHGNPTLYGLDLKDRLDVKVLGKDGKTLRGFSIGKAASTSQHTFVALGGKQVYHAAGDLRWNFDKKVQELRDKAVMPEMPEEITRVVFFDGQRELVVLKQAVPAIANTGNAAREASASAEPEGSAEKPRWLTEGGERVDEAEIEKVVNTLKGLRCNEFIEGREKADFTDPSYTVTIKGARDYTLSLYEKQDNNMYEAVSSESEYPFLLSEWNSAKLMQEFDLLVQK